MAEQTPPAAPDGGAEGTEVQTGALTPEEKALAADKKLAAEAAKWRKSTREAEAREAALKAELDSLKAEKESESAAETSSRSKAAHLERQLNELRDKEKAREAREKELIEKSRKKAIQSSLTSIAAEAKLNEAASAVALLERHAEVADDDNVVFKVKDPETGEVVPVEATAENVRKYKLLPFIFFPSSGGSGSGGGSFNNDVAVEHGIDMNRASTDFAYYQKHRDKIIEIMRRTEMSRR